MRNHNWFKTIIYMILQNGSNKLILQLIIGLTGNLMVYVFKQLSKLWYIKARKNTRFN